MAEEGHFTRAAERLQVSQPALSTQIRQLEDQLQSTLFRRCGRHVELTAAGEALLPRAEEILGAWSTTVTEIRAAAAAEERVLRVGFIANAAAEMTPQILAAFSARRPDWRVRWHQPLWDDPTAGLLGGDADVALLRLPVPGAGKLHTRVIFTEPRWLALAEGHPLARQNVVRFEQLLDEPFVATPANTGPWRDFWLASAERLGRPVIIGAEVKSSDEWMEALANGYGVCFTGASSARYYPRPAVVYRPVDRITPSKVAVAWERYDRRDIIRDFVAACDEVATSSRLPQP